MLKDYNFNHSPQLMKSDFKQQLKAWIECQEGVEFNPLDKCNNKQNRRIRYKTSSFESIPV
ncbi:MAG: hypothetical protein MJZ36_05905 [Bacteroidaceae bacterium]|nr:hypothetical protein [Bacteroidaceae bacterium]